MQKAWFNNYINIPYLDKGRDSNGLDCWGLVRLVYKQEFDIDLPSLTDTYTSALDSNSASEALSRYREGWVESDVPQSGDVILLRTVSAEDHVGIVTMPGYFLHVRSGCNSTIESYTSSKWKNRVVGIYRYSANPEVLGVNGIPSPLCSKVVRMQIPEGISIQELADRLANWKEIPDEVSASSDIVIILNGSVVDKTKWSSTILKCTDQVQYRVVAKGGGGGGIFKIFAVIMIAIIAWYVAPLLVPGGVAGGMGSLSATAAAGGIFGGMSQLAAGQLVAGAINMVGGLLLNAIFPTRPPSQDQAKNPGTPTAYKAITGQSNQVQQYGALPVVLGKIKFSPPAAVHPYVNNKTTYNILNTVVTWGYGPLAISRSSLKVDSKKISDFAYAESRTYDGFYDEAADYTFNQAISLYGKEVVQEQVDIETQRLVWLARSLAGEHFNDPQCETIKITWDASNVIVGMYTSTGTAIPHNIVPGHRVILYAKNSSGYYSILKGYATGATTSTQVYIDLTDTSALTATWKIPNFTTLYGSTGTNVGTIVAKVISTTYVDTVIDEHVSSIQVDILFPNGCRSIRAEGPDAGDVFQMSGNHTVQLQPLDTNGVPVGGFTYLDKTGEVLFQDIPSEIYSLKPELSEFITRGQGVYFYTDKYFTNHVEVSRTIDDEAYYYILSYIDSSRKYHTVLSSTTNDVDGGLPTVGTTFRTLYDDLQTPTGITYNSGASDGNPGVDKITNAFTNTSWLNWARGFNSVGSLKRKILKEGGTIVSIYRVHNDIVQPSSVYSYDMYASVYTLSFPSVNYTVSGTTTVTMTINTSSIWEFVDDRVIKVDFTSGPATSYDGLYYIGTVVSKDISAVKIQLQLNSPTTNGTGSLNITMCPISSDKFVTINDLTPTIYFDSVLDGFKVKMPASRIQYSEEADPTIVCGLEGQRFYKRKDSFCISATYNVDPAFKYRVRVFRSGGWTHDYTTREKGNKYSNSAQSKVLTITGRKTTAAILDDNFRDSDNNKIPLAITAVKMVSTNNISGNMGALTGIAQTICKDYTGSDIKTLQRFTNGNIVVTTRQAHKFITGASIRFSGITNATFSYLNDQTFTDITATKGNLYTFTLSSNNTTATSQVSISTGEVYLAGKYSFDLAIWSLSLGVLKVRRPSIAGVELKNGWVVTLTGTGNATFDSKQYKVSEIEQNIIDNKVFVSLKPYNHTITATSTTISSITAYVEADASIYTKWIKRPTNNNASLFRYVLQHPGNIKRVKDARIDLDTLAYWHKFCRRKGFSYNNLIVGSPQSVDSVLRDIAAAGMASPAYPDSIWSVVIDEPRTLISQHITPNNSWGFEGVRTIPKRPHAFRVPFLNELKDWAPDEIVVCDTGYFENPRLTSKTITVKAVATTEITTSGSQTIDGVVVNTNDIVLITGQPDNASDGPNVYYGSTDNGLYVVNSSGPWTRHTAYPDSSYYKIWDTYTVSQGTVYAGKKFVQIEEPILSTDPVRFDQYIGPATVLETLELPGVTNPRQAKYLARFHLAQLRLRPETYSVNMDVEHIACTRGSLVRLTHDVPMFGMFSGRIISTYYNSGTSKTTLTFDSTQYLLANTTYTIRIRADDGVSHTYNTVQKDTTEYYDSIEVSGNITGTITEGNLFMFGELDSESLECIVLNVEPMDNISAKLTLVDYSPEIYYLAANDNPIGYQDSGITPALDDSLTEIDYVPQVAQFITDERVMEKISSNQYSYGFKVVFQAPLANFTYLKASKADFLEVELDYSSSVDDKEFSGSMIKKIPLVNATMEALFTSVDPNSIIEVGETYKVRARYYSSITGLYGKWTTANNYKGTGVSSNTLYPVESRTSYLDTYCTGYTASTIKSYDLRYPVFGPSAKPKQISGLTVTPTEKGVQLRWNDNDEPDILYYEIRLEDANWGDKTDSTGAPSSYYVGRASSTSKNITLDALGTSTASTSITYYVKARDILGQFATTASSVTFTYSRPGTVPDPKLSVLSTSGKSFTTTYTITGTTCTVNKTSHGLIVPDVVMLDFSSGSGVDGKYTLNGATSNTFTVPHSSVSTSGTVNVISVNSKRVISFDWDTVDTPTGLPIAGYEIRSTDAALATWGTSGYIYRGKASQAQLTNVPVGTTSTWYLRAYDTLGNYSNASRVIQYDALVPNNITSAVLRRVGTSLSLTIVATKPSDFGSFRIKIGKINDGILDGTNGISGTNDFWSDTDVIYEEDIQANTLNIPLSKFNYSTTGSSIYTKYRCAIRIVDKAGNESPNSYICSYTYSAPV